ncbi:PTS sugar transporter subunit IIB [Clostridium paraputrificum]|uniref:PTS sugar transporter subunit IIB n=1 Tax=Clostridium paraputrificum TaxID=29363 RepID=UPI0006665564|nr:PTS sugar transporter subunit IIB [Clostridium paraputrificum]MDB2105912.1 PTS sugar transporter subunit IIB [Clostridium paraputrificum]MDB2112787.1 PTS sugar transporter subunit IIB [Clostridium paraputrificum]
MVRIALFCSAGASTGILTKKMLEAAEEKQLEVSIHAYPENQMEKLVGEIDIALLGPQILFKKNTAEKIFNPANIKVMVIPPADYGRMDGKKVLEKTLEELKK